MVPNLSQPHFTPNKLFFNSIISLYNNFGENGAKFISNALQANSSLTELNLSYNNTGENGAKFISTALQTISSLTKLNLDGNGRFKPYYLYCTSSKDLF